jgi:hypothetical protein
VWSPRETFKEQREAFSCFQSQNSSQGSCYAEVTVRMFFANMFLNEHFADTDSPQDIDANKWLFETLLLSDWMNCESDFHSHIFLDLCNITAF